mmetsp:Transcript_23100/g.52920  ORF Transcript_23100/g.52920 Transcript_23100/m.52920 type:complete len:297 (+) Transcript_23100:716-1606(+)
MLLWSTVRPHVPQEVLPHGFPLEAHEGVARHKLIDLLHRRLDGSDNVRGQSRGALAAQAAVGGHPLLLQLARNVHLMRRAVHDEVLRELMELGVRVDLLLLLELAEQLVRLVVEQNRLLRVFGRELLLEQCARTRHVQHCFECAAVAQQSDLHPSPHHAVVAEKLLKVGGEEAEQCARLDGLARLEALRPRDKHPHLPKVPAGAQRQHLHSMLLEVSDHVIHLRRLAVRDGAHRAEVVFHLHLAVKHHVEGIRRVALVVDGFALDEAVQLRKSTSNLQLLVCEVGEEWGVHGFVRL